MNTNTKSTKTEAETTEATFSPAAYTTLFSKGLERVVEASQSSLDLAAAQNTEVLASCKKALKGLPTPGFFLFDLASEAFEGYVTLQKGLLDLAVQQSSAVIEASQDLADAGKAKAAITNLIEESVDRSVVAQKSVQDFAAKQTKALSDAVKQQPGVVGTVVETVTDTVQRGVDTVLASQKEVLAVATKNLKASVAKA